MKNSMIVKLFWPDKQLGPFECDDLSFIVPDSVTGKHTAGSYEIRPGHEGGMIAVAPGPLSLKLGGKTVFETELKSGFLAISGDEIEIIQ